MLARIRALRLVAAALLTVAVLVAGTVPASAAPPGTPAIRTVEVHGDEHQTLTLSWDHVGGTLGSYEIYYRPSGTSAWLWSSTSAVGAGYGSWVPVVAGQTTYTRDFRIKDARPGTTYDLSVRALSTTGESSSRNLSTTQVTLNPAMGTPTAMSDAVGELTIVWPAYTASPVIQYDLFYGTAGSSPSWRARVADPSATRHTFTGLTPGQEYTVGVRATQSNRTVDGKTQFWVRSPMVTATAKVASTHPSSNELFTSSPTSAFVSTSTGEPFVVNGVNLKRSVHRSTSGAWQTEEVAKEIRALGASGAPDFNAVRIAMDWPYFQRALTAEEAALGGGGEVPASKQIVLVEEAFAQLDLLIDEAIEHDLYVILDPIHLITVGSTRCDEDPVMRGAHRNIPAWAWAKAGTAPGVSCENGDRWTVATDDALALPETAEYLRHILDRYDPDTAAGPAARARGRQVIAVDLVNEPNASPGRSPVNAAAGMQTLVDEVYGPWLADTGEKSLRTANPDKILVVESVAGSGTLVAGLAPVTKSPVLVDLSPIARPNVVLSVHDYVAAVTRTDPTYGLGYSAYGFATANETTDAKRADGLSPYDPGVQGYAQRRADRTAFLTQFKNWAAAYDLPLYVGEYGILNSCRGGNGAPVLQYAKDSYSVYEELGLSRTVWTHGSWDDMAIWWRGSSGTCEGASPRSYLPHAAEYTGGALR